MIQFHSFKAALNHQPNCPLCAKPTHINDRDLAYDWESEGCDRKARFAFFINKSEDDTITIDPETDEVDLVLRQRMPDTLYDYTKQTYYAPATPIYNGTLIHGLTIDCKNCCQYSYTLQIHFNLTEKRLAKIVLNSENISIEDGSMVHEIKNLYSMNKTEYSSFSKEGDSHKSALPLLPLDLDNPQDTIARIRKLLVFS